MYPIPLNLAELGSSLRTLGLLANFEKLSDWFKALFGGLFCFMGEFWAICLRFCFRLL